MSPDPRIPRALALAGYFGLLTLLVAWYAWLAPSRYFPVALTLLVMVTPLLLALRGLLAGRPYTHAWTSLLSLFYLAHGLGELIVVPGERLYSGLEVVLSLLLFSGSVLYARWEARRRRALDS